MELLKLQIKFHDIVPDRITKQSQVADLLLLKGLMFFKINERLYITDFLIFSIYEDAEVENIEKWYLDRSPANY